MNAPSTIRWGIAARGGSRIVLPRGSLSYRARNSRVIWSRRAEPTQAFAEQFDTHACESFDALLGNVDALYIATMQDSHPEYALRALKAGRAVLCEKPAAVNARALQRMIDVARSSKLLFMEAMKPPFYPLYRQLRDISRPTPSGRSDWYAPVARSRTCRSRIRRIPWRWAAAPCWTLVSTKRFSRVDWLGEPLDVQTIGRLGQTGVDTFASLNVRHERGGRAALLWSRPAGQGRCVACRDRRHRDDPRELVESGACDDPLSGWPHRRAGCAVRRWRPELRDHAFLRFIARGDQSKARSCGMRFPCRWFPSRTPPAAISVCAFRSSLIEFERSWQACLKYHFRFPALPFGMFRLDVFQCNCYPGCGATIEI